MEDVLPSGLLEICLLVGVPRERVRALLQGTQRKPKSLPPLDPEVLSVFVPPFISRDDTPVMNAGNNLNKSKRRSFRKKKERPKVENVKSLNVEQKAPDTEDITVPKDIDLLGLPQLCFPGGLYITSESKEDHIHFLVFTDVCGNRTYGVVAQYYQPLQDGCISSNGQAHWESAQPGKMPVCFVPFAVCVISRYPYFNALKDCLSCLLVQLRPLKDLDVEEHMKEFAAKLFLIPSPPPGPLHLVFNMKPLQIIIPSREDPDSPIIDLDLHLPLLCFRPEQVLQIMTCILTEQRIVFFSSDWALLTLVAECFMLYLHPLQWQHTFVPLLSRQMLDFVMAPTSFLMGCHIDHFEEVSMEIEDLVLINIDNGDITHSKMAEEEPEIPDVPAQAAETFIKRVGSLQLHYDLELCHLRASTDLGELQMRRRAWQQKLNAEVQQTALQLIVNIFREVKDHLNYEHRVFNSEEFLKTRAIGDQPFYRKVLETYMFHSFLKARLNRKMDAFARMDLSTQTEDDRFNLMFHTPRRLTMEKMASKRFSPQYVVSRRMVISMPDLQEITLPEVPTRKSSLRKLETGVAVRMPSKSISTFKIPEIHFPLIFQCVHSYYTDFYNHLSKAINTLAPDNSALLARYFYLRGLISLMQGKLLNALSDFQNLDKTDLRIFPTDLVRKIVETMAPAERLQADRKPELKKLISRVMENQREVMKIDDHVKNFELPKTHMQLDDFVKRIQESGIVKDIDTIHRLFDALTVGHQKQIDPETFRDFYNYWKETEAEAQEVNLPPTVIEHLDKNECVYKLSSSVKTNYGVGKIALTQKRLFLLTEGGRPGYVQIAAFRDIEDVKSTTVAFLLLRIPTLRIKTLSKKEVFEANLKTECDLWYLIVKEMWAGKKMADDHKDPQYIQQALTNVLLMDAVVGALQSSKTIYAASKLSYFDRMKNEVPMMVPKTTSETLKHKINPSAGETFPQAIDVLLYTPGHLDPSERPGNAHPKLWCALSEGKAVVFDASTWSIQQHCFKMGRSKLTCMIMVEQSQVWIGSQDSNIYIINTHSMSCNKQLNDHRSDVTDIVVDKKNGIPSDAYSSSLDGTVIAWNISTLKVNRVFQLPCQNLTSIKLHNDQLWCCTGSCILVVSTHEFQLQLKIEHHLKDVCSYFLCFQLFLERDEVWASYSGSSDLYIWNTKDFSSPPQKIHLQDCSEITCMIRVKNQMWVGSSARLQGKSKGKIYVVSAEKKTVEKELVGHADTVRALCSAEDRYVLSGSGREEGKIAIWKAE
ncbi:DENN domain-containing protein 3 isoform X1 [Pezoporus wallicus]|uniref:DENN domain-containing protein 3 isoform X1 n=2 Tax=Pezoporus wallicus TaxID=35540 RepID=UPI00254C41A9|nr:DENN domain-containing protein 3 isoform X1 [Pezoporus wallicus]XP_061303616.1 DENN domain-containing protein 3 isoform X1 [Pezoporus flaviventris]